MLTYRIGSKFDPDVLKEQVAFLSYESTDHIYVIDQVMEQHVEYFHSLCTAFVNYEKISLLNKNLIRYERIQKTG